jgi:gliding motility-associated-like protein
VNWVTLDSRINQLGGTTPRGATFSYTIATPGTIAFKYYRIQFTANNGATDGVRFQVAEWQIMGLASGIPDLPTNLQVTGTTISTISLSWNEGATNPVSKFILQRSADGIYYNTIATPPASPFIYTDTNLLDSATYYYRIQAIGVSSPTANAGWSNVAKGLTGFNNTGIPFIPGNLAVTSIADTVINLSWADRSNNETGFKLERSRDSVTFVQIKDLAANTVAVSDSTVFPANVFYYRIRSYNSKGASAYSNIVKVTTTGLNSAPMATVYLIDRKICSGAGTYNTTFNGIVPGPHYESSQTMHIASVTSDTASAKFFSGFNFSPTMNDGRGYYGFKTTGKAMVGDSATVLIKVKDNGGHLNGGLDSAVFSIKVYFVPLTITITADKPVIKVPRYTLLNLTASSSAPENTSYVWSNADGIEGAKNQLILQVRPVKTTTYTVTATTSLGCQATASITVAPQDSMVVANALTPNGDGKNDKWIVWGIEKNQNNSVKVIDRAGTIVFQKKNYANDWDGSYNGSLLPEGAYYYVVNAGDGSKVKTGMLTIVRDHK